MSFSLKSRLFSKVVPGRRAANPDLPWVLVVAHVANRTGAPILAQNIAAALSARYNVVIYSLVGGTLVEDFRDACVEVRLPRRFLSHRLRHGPALSSLAAERPLRFAVLNSSETHPATAALSRAGVPFIALMHEFAAMLANRDQVRRWFDAAGAVVFSATVTRDDAERRIGLSPGTRTLILPQGKCVIPGSAAANNPAGASKLAKALRPEGAEAAFLVLGAGTVEYRKGVDLFVSIAALARAAAPEIPWRFVWIGGSLEGQFLGDYRFLVADQIDRLFVGDIVSVLKSSPEIETAYRSANVFLLSSRLDPLPNVAIDALTAGLPVLIFDAASGVAELQRRHDLDQVCVAPYLDSVALAERLVSLARSTELCRSVGEASAGLAREHFQMDRYASQLIALAEDIRQVRKPQA